MSVREGSVFENLAEQLGGTYDKIKFPLLVIYEQSPAEAAIVQQMKEERSCSSHNINFEIPPTLSTVL